MKVHKYKNFISIFDEKTGGYLRSNLIKDGKDAGVEPFMAPFPELIDVGVMGHCAHGRAGLCTKAGIECYQDGLHADFPNMSIEDFCNIAEQCRGKVFQFALGGCGDPDQHENFAELLTVCRQVDIVPNFTTSGIGLTERTIALCKEYCGAVAVSWYRSDYTLRAIDMLVKGGVKTNIHYVLNRNTIKEAVDRLENHTFPRGINAIVFLLHKPVGLGKEENMIHWDDVNLKRLIKYIDLGKSEYKIGFDSCSVPALINDPGMIDLDSLDTCEGARWSAYITPDMKMLPCSFDNQEQRWSVDLKKYSIQEAWLSDEFVDFRSYFQNSCPTCEKRELCMGGCPIRPQIVLCKDKAGIA